MSNQKKAKNWIIGLIILAVLLAIGYALVKFQKSDKKVADYIVPKLTLTSMQLTNLTAERADVKMKMIIDNPAPIGFTIDSLYYEVFIADQQVARTTYPDTLRLEAKDSTKITLPLTLYYDKLKEVTDRLAQQGQDSVNYRVNATIFSKTKLIPKDKFNLKVEKRLPLVTIPEVKITDIKITDLKFKGATMQVAATVKNRNVFSLGLKDMAYSVKIEDNEAVEGNKPGTINIPAKGTANFTIPVQLTFKEMGKTLIDFVKEGKDVSYDVKLKTELVTQSNILQDSKINLNTSGKLKTVLDAVKENVQEKKAEKKEERKERREERREARKEARK
ncbi:NDR1/HIN1-like protein [Adhaeribacter radiodurans]|uniref:LEA type 2 family protein n=1 Tax=Adhaeribacter radiodurans TaxID=2745197 RepID=A0A7L7L8H0_9BACT|nr:LEA type 2 family protein [Adhaeribacter radiodurans]QMU29132.1 LEA type 2 family protein [Adhaeribacter radiodurans]